MTICLETGRRGELLARVDLVVVHVFGGQSNSKIEAGGLQSHKHEESAALHNMRNVYGGAAPS